MTGFPDDGPDGAPDGTRGEGPGSGKDPGFGGGSREGSGFGNSGDPDADLGLDLGLDLGRDLDGDRLDARDPLLRPPTEFLPVPAGAFGRIRRRAARRRRVRAAVGGALVAATLVGSVYVAGALTGDGPAEVVAPPAGTTQGTVSPPATADATPSRPPATTPEPPASSPPVTTPTSTGSAVPPPAATTTTAGTPLCTAAQLTASLGGGDAGAGNLYRYLLLTNTGDAVCHVTGYPGLSLLDAGGKQIGAPATYVQLARVPVVLAPGQVASATIHTINHQGTCLPASAKLRIYPPGSRASLVFSGEVTNCDDLFTVTPFAAGSTGNPPS